MIQPQMNADERRSKASCDTGYQPVQKAQHGLVARVTNLRSSAFICGSNSLRGAIVWCDPQGKLYPPAVAAMGVPLNRVVLVVPKTIPDENWAIAECLRCRGVSAMIASPRRLSRIERGVFNWPPSVARALAFCFGRTITPPMYMPPPPAGSSRRSAMAHGSTMEDRTDSRSWRTNRTGRHPGHYRETNSIQMLPVLNWRYQRSARQFVRQRYRISRLSLADCR